MGVNTLPYNSSGAARFGLHQLALTVDDVNQRLQLVQNVIAEIGPVTISFTSAAYPDFPAWAAVGNAQCVYIFIAGVSLAIHAAGISVGVALPKSGYPNAGSNSWYTTAAQRIFDLTRASTWQTAEIRIIGHSAGGCVGLNLFGIFATQAAFPSTKNLISFGSPKPGNRDFQGALSSKEFTRFFLPIDPVPIFPPGLDDVLATGTIVPSGFVRTSSDQVQPRGGVELTGQLTFDEKPLPSLARMTPFTSLADWLLNIDQGGAGLHSIQAYEIWFHQFFAASAGGGDWDAPTAESGPQTNTPLTARRANQYERAVQTALALSSQNQNVQPVGVPKVNQLVAVRIDGQWCVVFNTSIISIEATRRHAQAVARIGNMWLERVLTSALVDPNAIVSSLQGFLASAQDPTSGITPLLSTQLTINA